MFDIFSAHQKDIQLFFEVRKRGKFPMLKGISFQALRAEYENLFLAYSRLYLGLWIFLQNLVLYLE